MTLAASLNWAAPYQPQRDRYWPEVEQFFSQLSPLLWQQGMLLKNNLATFYSETGQFKDILGRRHDPPLLYWHLWLLDDWAYPAGAERTDLEQSLFLAMSFAFAAQYTQTCILDASSNFDPSYLFLAQTLSQQSDYYLARLFPLSSPFWQHHRTLWQETAEAGLMTADRRPPTAEFMPSLLTRHQPLAYTKIPIMAVALKAGRAELLPQVEAMLNRLNRIMQILGEIATLRRDLGQRRLTYPILKTMQAAGLDPLQPISPEQLLGALVLTGAIEKIGQECLAELAEARAMAESLQLPTFAAYSERLAAGVDEARSLFSLKARPISSPRSPFFRPYVEPLAKVIDMAEGYLRSDLTFRESWEVQRRGVFGATEMTGKAFPMGLIVEILSRHGHDMSAPINEIFETLQASGFRYYNHPHLPPDTDDLGLLLRLYPYSPQPERHRDMLQAPLGWLKESIAETGEFPVWLAAGVTQPEAYPFLALWGQHCATVEANLLLGLIAYDRPGYEGLLEKSLPGWCKRVAMHGLSATRHYIPLYAVWTAFELLQVMSDGDFIMSSERGRVFQILLDYLTHQASRPQSTPQTAAFLILAYLSIQNKKTSRVSKTLEVSVADWLTLLCKTQRYDGSWAAEPLYGTPTRGEFAAWYSSRTVTTAFCYHALKWWMEDRGQGVVDSSI